MLAYWCENFHERDKNTGNILIANKHAYNKKEETFRARSAFAIINRSLTAEFSLYL